jgi:hypothetical protein
MGENLTCLTTFVTGDPSPNRDMNLRLDHTHFFSQNGKQVIFNEFNIFKKIYI